MTDLFAFLFLGCRVVLLSVCRCEITGGFWGYDGFKAALEAPDVKLDDREGDTSDEVSHHQFLLMSFY